MGQIYRPCECKKSTCVLASLLQFPRQINDLFQYKMNVALRMGFWKMQVVIQILFFFKKAQDSHSVALACTLSSVFFFPSEHFHSSEYSSLCSYGSNPKIHGVCFYRGLVLLGDTPIHIRRCKCRCPSSLCTNLEFRVDFLENFAKSRRNSPHSNFRRFYSHFSLEKTRLTK